MPFALGDPHDLVRRVHDVGSLAMLQVTTVRQARHAAERGVDAHPQVYVDVGIIGYNQPRPAFFRYLQAIFDAGFTNRVMFGSDQVVRPGTIERAIAVIDEAPFLTARQKCDIFYNNAARFLRLTKDDIARHHRR